MTTTIKTILTTILLGLSCLSMAQTESIQYTYDNAGNRIKRERVLIINPVPMRKAAPEVQKMDEKVVLVYPNPTRGEFKIEMELAEKDEVSAVLFDNQGKMLKSIDIKHSTTEVSIHNMPEGIYFLKVLYNDEVYEWKIIKQ